MSFNKIKFVFVPPPTIPSSLIVSPIPIATRSTPQFSGQIAGNSIAAGLINRLTVLNSTSLYLQQVIQSLTKTLGITFDLLANPDLALSLGRIYNTSTPPESMDMQMYLELLAADINFLRFDLLNPPDSPVQINPVQRTDINLVAKSFENGLINTGVYNQSIPILLRSLQGDQLIFDQWKTAISQYPVLAFPQSTPIQLAATTPISDRALNSVSTDVSTPLATTMNLVMDKWGESYTGMYKMLATPDPVEVALPTISSALSAQPLSDILRLKTTLDSLISFVHQPQLQQQHDSVDNLVVPRLLSDAVAHTTNLDYVKQVASDPSSGFTGALGNIMKAFLPINPGQILDMGLTGLIKTRAGGVRSPALTGTQQLALSGVSAGLSIFAANAQWAQNEVSRQHSFVTDSLQRLGLRKIGNQGNHTEVLTSMRSLSSSIGLLKALLSFDSKSGLSSSSSNVNRSTPSVGLQSFGTLIGSLKSQSGSSYSVDGQTLIIAPPSVPTAPSDVQGLLKDNGVTQFTTDALREPINLGV